MRLVFLMPITFCPVTSVNSHQVPWRISYYSNATQYNNEIEIIIEIISG